MRMEILLTVMGWVSVGILAWFVFGWVRGMFRSMKKLKAQTDNVKKEMY